MFREEIKKSEIEKFDGTDFSFQKIQIEDYPYEKKLHFPLLREKPEDMSILNWNLHDRQILGVIQLTMLRSVAYNKTKEKKTTELMATLFEMYEKLPANNKMHLMKKLFNLKMAEGMSVTQHLNKFNNITNQFSFLKNDFDDEIQVLILLVLLLNS